MLINKKTIKARGIKLFVKQGGKEVARAFLYIMKNDLHKESFCLMEDVFVDEKLRGQGIGTTLVKKIIAEAKKNKCYKLITTSRHKRPKVHALYERLGFKNHGLEFRIDFKK